MKFHILIYGCQFNYADSARIKRVLESIGWKESDFETADIIIFDTCSVRQKAEDKIWGKLNEIPKDKKIWLTGCMISRYGNGYNEKLKIWAKLKKKFNNVDLIFSTNLIGELPFILRNYYEIDEYLIEEYKKNNFNTYLSIFPNNPNPDGSSLVAYVPIQIGCSQFCSYCIVPFSRGLEKNRPFDEILSEVKYHVNKGAKEIILVGQIVNKHPDFYKILKEILKLDIKRLRYTSPYPTYYNDDILKLHENEEKLTPHIHVPVQSGSDKILKYMFRGYTIYEYKKFIDNIKKLKRDISITTDIIVGFPYEDEKDFNDTLDIVEYARFDMIYIGIYSPRPGTYAAKKYPDNVPNKIKKERWHILNEKLKKISYENNLSEIGKIKEIYVKEINDNGIGYDEKLKNVIVTNNVQKGKYYKVKITSVEALKLFGQVV